MGNTNMPSAPNDFSLPMISQKCFSAITDWTDTQFPSASGVMVGLFMPGSTSMISCILSFGAFSNTYFLPYATWIASKRNNSSSRIACFSSDKLLLAINRASLCMMTSTSLS